MKKFEYMDIITEQNKNGEMVFYYLEMEFNFSQYFNSVKNIIGNEGWELIGTTPIIDTTFENQALIPLRADTIVSNVRTIAVIYHFKRELEEEIELDQEFLIFLERVKEEKEYLKKNPPKTKQEIKEIKEKKKEELIKKYTEEGYSLGMNHPQRVTFEKWDGKLNNYITVVYNLVEGEWLKK